MLQKAPLPFMLTSERQLSPVLLFSQIGCEHAPPHLHPRGQLGVLKTSLYLQAEDLKVTSHKEERHANKGPGVSPLSPPRAWQLILVTSKTCSFQIPLGASRSLAHPFLFASSFPAFLGWGSLALGDRGRERGPECGKQLTQNTSTN